MREPNHLSSRLRLRSRKGERGVTAIEYALMGTLVAIALVGGLRMLGGSLQGQYGELGRVVLTAIGG